MIFFCYFFILSKPHALEPERVVLSVGHITGRGRRSSIFFDIFVGYLYIVAQLDNANGSESEDIGFQAPLVKKGSKLRLARPDERHPRRLENHQTEWGILHGMFLTYRKGDVPVARGYLNRYAKGREDLIISLLKVWAVEASDETLRRGADALIFGLK